MTEIVVLAINARWTHAAFGARAIVANLGALKGRATLVEKTINDRPIEIAEAVLAFEPTIVGLGVYIWNVSVVTEVVALLKAVCPNLTVVLGGPEVICGSDMPAVAEVADCVISGEAEVAFRDLCTELLAGSRPPNHRLVAVPPDLNTIESAYALYNDDDIGRRKIYLEASRGCPFGCTFCLSSLDERVRKVSAVSFLHSLQVLWERGVRHFRFVDRAMHCSIGPEILTFFLDRYEPGTFLHFEVVPDRLPNRLRDLLPRFAPGSVQLEVGVQTFNPDVARRIDRLQDAEAVERTVGWLRSETGVHIHADLVVGLPGEGLESFAAGFDRLVALAPHEIQVGLLKRLRGTPLARDAESLGLVFNPSPPYEVLHTRDLDFRTVFGLRRFARYFDLVHNNGRFPGACALLLGGSSPFAGFAAFSHWLFRRTGQSAGIALNRLARLLAQYLCEELGLATGAVERVINGDFEKAGREPIPLGAVDSRRSRSHDRSGLPERQARHQKGDSRG